MATEMKRATLLTVVKMLNATKDSKGNNIATKVPIVAIGTKELTEKFLAACESVLPENEELLLDQVCDAYNVLVGDRETIEEPNIEEEKEPIQEGPPPIKESKPEKKKELKTEKKVEKGMLSNKYRVWKVWKDSEQKKTPEELLEVAPIKLGTIKCWIGMWRNNKGLPAGALG